MVDRSIIGPGVARLIFVPALITLGITILRLVGELQGWSPSLFSPSPGGGGALIGIVWLAPLFGIYFALRLSATGEFPGSGRTIGFALLGIVVVALGIFLAVRFSGVGRVGAILIVNAATAIAGFIQFLGWPRLAKTLTIYGYAARVPVVIIMFFAIKGNWGTHYDGPPPNFPEMGWLAEFFWTGLLAQLISWVGFTLVTGSLFGGIATAIARRGKRVALASGSPL